MTSTPGPLTRSTLPKTLREWRTSGWEPKGTFPRDVWNSLEPFFLRQGLTLWARRYNRPRDPYVFPHNDLPRAPDAFVYSTPVSQAMVKPGFAPMKAVHCPARTNDNRDVLIRLVAKGDEGLNHLAALRRLATGHVAFRGENHIVPMLREIVFEDMVFVVFPLMEEGFNSPWYYNYSELVDAVYQVIEGLAFCHERLVAHLDIDSDNILINFLGGPRQEVDPQIGGIVAPPTPFREHFPIRYYLNDFELAACFDYDSDPSTRVVSGFPTKGLQGKYGREIAPEMLSEEPYCPFGTDVWQLGRMFLKYFQHLDKQWTPLTQLFTEMTLTDSQSRPTIFQALARVRQFRSTLSGENLASKVPRPPPEPLRGLTDELLANPATAPETDGSSSR